MDNNSTTISSYGYSATHSHAPVTYNGDTLAYDANGNLIDDEDFIYVYNDANQLSEVRYSANNSLVEKYWYDANGQRIKKQNSGGEFTYYINKFYEIDNGIATSYFFRDDERVAKQTSESMEWYLSDHIGSTSLMVDEAGLEVERTDYFPYGQVRSGGLEKYGFTGQENDADTGMMYYGARYYSPEYRVFVQPDTMLPDPYNPQALNRYSYALNNPVKYTDPSGHIPVDILLDAGFIVKDAIDIWNNPSDKWAWGALGADVACAFVPYITGGGLGVKGIKAANEIDNAVDAGRVIEHTGSLVTRYGDDTGEALAKMSTEIESKGIVGKNAGATGTLKHTEFTTMVDAWSKERGGNVYVEQSIDISGSLIDGRPAGSLRPDVMEIGNDGIVRIYDLKTGNANMNNKWMNNVEQRLMNTEKYNGVEFYRVKNGETLRVR